MGGSECPVKVVSASILLNYGGHESNEGHESCQSNESHEGNEGNEEGVCAPGQAPRVRWQGWKDYEWAQEVRFGEEQVRQDRQQEEASPRQGKPVDRSGQGCAGGSEDQGLLRHQKGLPIVHQGEGAL